MLFKNIFEAYSLLIARYGVCNNIVR